MEEKLLALLDRYDLRNASINNWQVLIQSFSADSLKTVHAMDPRLPLIFLGNPSLATIASYADYAVGLGPSFGASINANWVNTAHAACLDVHPYTINTVANMTAALNAGVDGMFTNFADILIGLIGDRKATGLQGAINAKLSHDACLARNAKGGVGGSVAGTLALTLGAPAGFGAFVPGVDRRPTRPARRPTSSPRPAARRCRSPTRARPRRASSSTARSRCRRACWSTRAARPARRRAPASGRRHGRPDGAAELRRPGLQRRRHGRFQAADRASDALRTGQYAKTLTLTLATTAP